MSDEPFTVLVLCTGNSARSILGEALFNHLGEGRVRAFSAGSKPKGMPHPGAIRLLARRGINSAAFRSKSWNEFGGPGSPQIDAAITVCGNAAEEVCPVFMGAPVKGHWGLPDPAEVKGDDAAVDAALEATWQSLSIRVRAFLASSFETMEPRHLQNFLNEIGRLDSAA